MNVDGEIEVKPVAAEASRLPATGDLRTLLAKLSIRTADDGRVSIEAPPEAAAGLAMAFEALAHNPTRQTKKVRKKPIARKRKKRRGE